MRVCTDCPTLIPTGTRCPTHQTERERARGTRQQRGYNTTHQHLRAHYQTRMDAGETFQCWRCNTLINPAAWHLGHDDNNRDQHRGPECIPCNTATSGRTGECPHPSHAKDTP